MCLVHYELITFFNFYLNRKMQFVHSSINNPEKLHQSKSNTFITWIPIVCEYLHNNNI